MSSSINATIEKVGDNLRENQMDVLATEEPLEIRLRYKESGKDIVKNLSVTMRTPGHDGELAVGFLFTEGIVKQKTDIALVSHAPGLLSPDPNVIEVTLDSNLKFDLKKLERNFYTTSSCGVCGKSSIDAVKVNCEVVARGELLVASDLLKTLPQKLRESQKVFESTGGLHASALFDMDGNLLMLREDVGRHNALDKLIGHCLMNGITPLSSSLLLLSGRASFELIQKAAVAGIPLVAAIGAPSSLAVQLATDSGITLIGFLKSTSFNIYSHGQRVS